jgi:hypothetical protein
MPGSTRAACNGTHACNMQVAMVYAKVHRIVSKVTEVLLRAPSLNEEKRLLRCRFRLAWQLQLLTVASDVRSGRPTTALDALTGDFRNGFARFVL